MTFVQQMDPLTGIPLVLGGLTLMAFGWRLWKVCVALTFGLIGCGVGAILGEGTQHQALFGLGGLVLLGLASFGPVKHSLDLLGGIVGAVILMAILKALGLEGPALWVAGGVALICFTALSAINRRYVLILITAFEGAVLLVTGALALMTSTPGMLGVVKSMAAASAIVVPFILLVPTTMSFFYQVSEVRRAGAEM
jgi:hypothetical protein